MDLIDIHVVRVEEAQAGLQVTPEGAGAAVAHQLPVAIPAQATLGGDHELVAPRSQLRSERLAQQLFRRAEAVSAGGIEEGDAEVERLAGGGDRRRAVDAAPVAAGRPVAEGDAGDTRPSQAELYVVHQVVPR